MNCRQAACVICLRKEKEAQKIRQTYFTIGEAVGNCPIVSLRYVNLYEVLPEVHKKWIKLEDNFFVQNVACGYVAEKAWKQLGVEIETQEKTNLVEKAGGEVKQEEYCTSVPLMPSSVWNKCRVHLLSLFSTIFLY